jgi:hypothetical protein
MTWLEVGWILVAGAVVIGTRDALLLLLAGVLVLVAVAASAGRLRS